MAISCHLTCPYCLLIQAFTDFKAFLYILIKPPIKIYKKAVRARVGRPQTSSSPPVIFIAGRPKVALLFWFFGDFRCGALLFMVIRVIYKYKNM